MKSIPKRQPTQSKRFKRKSGDGKPALKRSKLDVFDIPIDKLIDSPENPQEMDDATFDELVEGIRTSGFDEPIHVVRWFEKGKWSGKYMIVSGHHRKKAGGVVGLSHIPSVIRSDMDDAMRKVELVRRNQLKGGLNKKKFSELFREVSKELGAETAKRLMGFTKKAAFEKLYEDVSKALPKNHRKELDEAKETVKSVDDLSSILNGIFKKEGSKVTKGYMVFSFGGKEHHYFQIDKALNARLKEIEQLIDRSGKSAAEMFLQLLDSGAPTGAKKGLKNAGKNKAA